MLKRIKDVTLRDTVKSMDIRKELGAKSIQEKIQRNETKLVYGPLGSHHIACTTNVFKINVMSYQV